MRWFVIGGAGFIVVGQALVACVGDSSSAGGPEAGTLDQPCFANNTCVGALTCVSGVCVQLDGAVSMDSGPTDSGSNDSASCDAAPGIIADPCGAPFQNDAGGPYFCVGGGDGGICVANPMLCMSAMGPPAQCTQSSQCAGVGAGPCCAAVSNLGTTSCPATAMPGMMGITCAPKGMACMTGQHVVCTADGDCPTGTCHGVRMFPPPTPLIGLCL